MKLALVIALLAAGAYGQEIKVLLDNDWVKVTHIIDHPGDKRPTHTHKDSVVVALTDHRRRVIGNTTRDLDVKANAAMWFADVTHSEENIGKTDGELLLVDVKKPAGSFKPEADVTKWPDSLEAVTAAPGNHKIILENDRIRVLSVTVAPGEKEPLHMHRMPSVLYVIADDIQDFDARGKLLYDTRAQTSPPQTPYAEWMPPQAPHRVVNRGKNALRLIRVELK
jgi:mannose-6-phosphate isomerase-like protein (cupin superfamily)